jgi:Fur family zinc uptake transcriptional regulator
VVAALGLFIVSLLPKPRTGADAAIPGRSIMTTQTIDARTRAWSSTCLSHSGSPLSAYTILDKLRDTAFARPCRSIVRWTSSWSAASCTGWKASTPSSPAPIRRRAAAPTAITAFTICETCGQVEFHDHVIEDRLKDFCQGPQLQDRQDDDRDPRPLRCLRGLKRSNWSAALSALGVVVI